MSVSNQKRVKKMWYEKSLRILRNGVSMIVDAFDIQEGDVVFFLGDVPMTAMYAFPDNDEEVLFIACSYDCWPADMFLSH